MKKLFRTLAPLLLAAGACSAYALPTIQSPLFFTDSWGASVESPLLNGNYLHMFTTVVSSDPPSAVSAVATQGTLTRGLSFYTTPIFAEKNFEVFLSDTSLTGAWDLAVTDSSGTSNGVFPAIVNPQLLPLLQGLQVTGGGLMPTVTWTLPDLTGFDVDDLRIRAVVAGTGQQIFQSALLSSSATSFTIPTGVLQNGVGYEFRVLLEDFDGTRLENRSNTFTSVYTNSVPEPGSLALTALALASMIGLYRRRRQG